MSDRITHLDTVRGAAVMGILVMNGVSFGLGNVAYFDISYGTETGLDSVLAVLGEVLADQKFMGLFSLLFGASILLFLERAEARGRKPVWLSLWRNILLLLIGILHSILWVGDILVVYALCAPVLLAMRRRSGRVLLTAGVLVFSIAPMLDWTISQHALDNDIVAVWTSNLQGLTADLVGLGIVAHVFARALGMMLIGMGLYQSGRLSRIQETPALLRRSTEALIAGAALSGAGVAWTAQQGFGGAAILSGNLLNSLATLPMVLGYLGVLSWWDRHARSAWLGRIQALGRMALTNYLSQTVIFLILVQLTPANLVSRSTIWLGILGVWAAQLAWSERWLQTFRYGPLEWAWRCATYRRWEPLRRAPAPPQRYSSS